MWKIYVVVAMVLFVLVGCEMARRVDKAIWTPPPSIDGEETEAAPPMVEIVGGLLAACGFGGMATWVKKQGNGARRDMEAVNRRLVILENAVGPKDLVGAARSVTGGP